MAADRGTTLEPSACLSWVFVTPHLVKQQIMVVLMEYLFLFLPLSQRLVVKPDQLIKRRGKLGLIGINLDLEGVKEWLRAHLMKETTVSPLHSLCLGIYTQCPGIIFGGNV